MPAIDAAISIDTDGDGTMSAVVGCTTFNDPVTGVGVVDDIGLETGCGCTTGATSTGAATIEGVTVSGDTAGVVIGAATGVIGCTLVIGSGVVAAGVAVVGTTGDFAGVAGVSTAVSDGCVAGLGVGDDAPEEFIVVAASTGAF